MVIWRFRLHIGRDVVEGVLSRNEHRRNSDSSLYCKPREADGTGDKMKEPETASIEQAKYLDPDRAAFVQSYLDNVPDTLSMTTETSDSAVGTAESELGLEETSGKYSFFTCKCITSLFGACSYALFSLLLCATADLLVR